MIRKCSICDNKILEYGSKVLSDGIVCRDCVSKASVWLEDSDYEKMSLERFMEHLEYRLKNQEVLNEFKCDNLVEGKYFLYIDTTKRQFIFSKRLNPIADNADVFDLDKIVESKLVEEEYQDNNGVDLFFEVTLRDSEIEKIRFRMNEFGCIEKDSESYSECYQLQQAYKEHLLNPVKGEEIDMENKTGRKKHVVQGTISEIKKSDEGLGVTAPVGERKGLLTTLFNLFKGNKK